MVNHDVSDCRLPLLVPTELLVPLFCLPLGLIAIVIETEKSL
jgi:hypothetical protein